MIRFLFVFSLLALLPGCPPPECDFERNDSLGDLRAELIGRWEGELRNLSGDPRPVVIDFYEPGFRLETWTPDGVIVTHGNWGTRVQNDEWDRLDLYFRCVEGFPDSPSIWSIWAYYLDGKTLDFHSHTDSPNGEGMPLQDAPYYYLNRVD